MYSVFYLLLFEIHLMVETVDEDSEHIHLHNPHSAVASTHLRAHETVLEHVCRLLLEKKNK